MSERRGISALLSKLKRRKRRQVCLVRSLVALQEAARTGLSAAPLPCYRGDADAETVRVQAPMPEMAGKPCC